jgi:galactitol-specific phosphotransferase system IIB component
MTKEEQDDAKSVEADNEVAVGDHNEATINIDQTTYNVSELNEKTKNIVVFLRRLDQEIQETRFNLNKNMLARQQAITDLKSELKNLTPTNKP